MYKSGCLSISPISIHEPIALKKYFLMFDKLWVEKSSLAYSEYTIDSIYTSFKTILDSAGMAYIPPIHFIEEIMQKQTTQQQIVNLNNIQHLRETGFLEVFDFKLELFRASNNQSLFEIGYLLGTHVPEEYEIISNPTENLNIFPDLATRGFTIIRQSQEEDMCSILLQVNNKLKIGKKENVLRFLLSEIPEPTENVSWEQLVEFKADPQTMGKYYALIKWINEVARKDLTINEIKDEYNYLYYEYMNQYKIHKIKYTTGVLEVLMTAAIDVLSGQLGIAGVSTSLFNIWKQNLNLLEAETKFTGREVAYIYKAKGTFKQ